MHLENVDFELKVPLRDKYNKIFYRIGWEKDLKNRKTNQQFSLELLIRKYSHKIILIGSILFGFSIR
jgi:hypothetical protein